MLCELSHFDEIHICEVTGQRCPLLPPNSSCCEIYIWQKIGKTTGASSKKRKNAGEVI